MRPILVTGSHRSGTTWTGRMLCASGEAGYIHEPFNPRRRPGWSGDRIPYWYLCITEDNARFYEDVVEDVLAYRYPLSNLLRVRRPSHAARFAADWWDSLRYRIRRPRPLIKDPIALFAADWLARRFGMEVVVMIRNPVSFAGSLKRLGWEFRFRSWLAQPALADRILDSYRPQMQRLWAGEGDIVDQAIVMWNALHEVIDGYRRDHPGWHFVRHEDLAASPVDGFAALYEALGLTFDARVKETVAAHSDASNPGEVAPWRRTSVRRDSLAATEAWRARLTEEEAARARAGTAAVASRFYPEDV